MEFYATPSSGAIENATCWPLATKYVPYVFTDVRYTPPIDEV